MSDAANGGLGVGAAQLLLGHLLAGGGFDDPGAGDEHLALVIHHDDEVSEGGTVDRAAGAGPHDHGDLGDQAGGQGVAAEDLAVAGEGVHRLLDAGAAGVVEADAGAAGFESHVHDLADLGRVHLA